jgi:tetratricopeptide (TPR) repeat protein
MPLTKQQHQQLYDVLSKVNAAIEAEQTTPAMKKLTELNTKFPNQPMILTLLGKVNTKMGRHAEAIVAYEKTAKIDPKNPDIHFQLALALQKGGRYDESLVEYERALYHDPNHFLALRHKCSVLTDLDRNDEALKALDALKKSVANKQIEPAQHLAIAISTARLVPKVLEPKDPIKAIEAYVENETCDQSLRTAGYWQLGRLYDLLKEYDHAFTNYTKSKKLNIRPWNPDIHSKRINRLIECWTTEPKIPTAQADGSRLIFIIGMMRSGTSLTEQMLAQIEHLTPGGEMNAISRQVAKLEMGREPAVPHSRPYPYTKELYTKAALDKMSKAAMVMYDQIAKEGLVTDKQPSNYAYVPLIAHMFPGAKFIHCKRDPLDCCLSNFTQAFARPHAQTHDLYHLGRYFNDYDRLVAAWHTIDEVDMIDLHYEDMVADPETQSKRITAFLGIDWTPNILDFHKSSRTVSTASRDQVRKPLYTSSVKKYKRYEHHLDELKRGLGIE